MTLTWLVLIGATFALYVLAEQVAVSRTAIACVVLIAAFKVRLVFLKFMELESGAMPWRLVAEVWIGVVTAIFLGAYLATPSPLSP